MSNLVDFMHVYLKHMHLSVVHNIKIYWHCAVLGTFLISHLHPHLHLCTLYLLFLNEIAMENILKKTIFYCSVYLQ